jgi:MFS transporter, DHA1 family, multidrug resistance protein
VVLAGLALAAAASTAAIFAASITGLVIARAVQSLGASSGQTIARAIIRDLYDREQAASMIGLMTSVVVLMPMAAPLIGGLLDTFFGWTSIFVFVALLTLTVFLWAAFALPETHAVSVAPGGHSHLLADMRALASSPRFFGYALCAGLGSAPFFSFLGAAPYVVVDQLGRTSAEYGLWFFIPSIGFMAGNFAVSRLARRFTIDAMIFWGIVFTIAGGALNPVVYRALPGWEMATVFLPQIIIGFGNGLLLPTSIAGAVSIRPQVAGTASGMTGFIQMAIGAVAAQLSGHVLAGASDAMPMLWLTLFWGFALAAAFFALVWRRG